MKRKISIAVILALTATLAVSCSEDVELNNGGQEQQGNAIQFTVDDSQDWMQTGNDVATTRAMEQGLFAPKSVKMTSTSTVMGDVYLNTSVVNGIDADPMNQRVTRGETYTGAPDYIAVSGYSHASGSTPQAPNLFYNVTVHQDGNTWKPVNNEYYWPQDNTSSFFGYAPVATSNNGIELSPSSYFGKPYIDFTVQNDVDQQIDLMTACSGPLAWRSGIKARLPFKHALTCVKFVMGSGLPANCRISAIYLKNIAQKGTYYFDEQNPNWVASTTDFRDYSITGIDMETSTSENTVIKPKNGDAASATFLMIPQSFNSANQKIEVFFDDGANPESSLSATLEGTQWLAGTTVTYKLNSNANQQFVLEVVPALASHKGGETTFKVTSYKQNGNTKEAMPWRVIGYSTDGITYSSEKPSSQKWVGLMTTEGDGGTEPEMGYALVQPQTAETSQLSEVQDAAAQKAVMIGNGTRGSENNPWDLSTHNLAGKLTPMSTANCYIINAPGWYKIPLVYGNAITDGVENRDAYEKSPNLDYLDRAITDPYIYNNTDAQSNPYVPNDAIILWQDADSLVTNAHLSADKRFIIFHVDPETICQGNAVLCIRDNTADNDGHTGRIMWSWHIWVTGIDLAAVKTLVNANHRRFDILPVPVGFCSRGGTQATYSGHKLYVKIQQSSGTTAVLSIDQLKCVDFTAFANGYAPYYTWGRPVPYRPGTGYANGTSETDKVVYMYANYAFSSTSGKMASMGTAIQKPYNNASIVSGDIHYINCSMYRIWDGNAALNYNAPATNYTTLKTIYDPCPAGWHIPNVYTFTGLTDEDRISNYIYYTDETHEDRLFIIPFGLRNSKGSTLNTSANHVVGGTAFYLLNRTYADGKCCALYVTGSTINTNASTCGGTWGYSIFASAER